jgi:hypothetical protein
LSNTLYSELLIHINWENRKEKSLMPTTGIEPVTFALRERRSTTELNRHIDHRQKKLLLSVLLRHKYFFFAILLVHLWSSSTRIEWDRCEWLNHRMQTLKEKKRRRELPARWPFFFVHIYIHNCSKKRTNICIIQLLTVVVAVALDRRKTISLLHLYNNKP